MAVTPFDSGLYRDLFGDVELGRLFTDTAEVRALLLVEGALAKAQGMAGLIPQESAALIHRASMEAQIDPTSLAAETGRNGVNIPALVAAFRTEIGDPTQAQFAHFGATSQDIIDTALALRLRQAIGIIENRMNVLLTHLAELAETHAATPCAGHTYGQIATVTSFGATAAIWGTGLLRHAQSVERIRKSCEIVTLNGAAGTLASMGTKGGQVRAEMAKLLRLNVPDHVPHAARGHIAELAHWLNGICQTLGKMAADLILLCRDGQVRLANAGGSSTMPQKQNPVGPSAIGALAAHANGLNHTLQGAVVHREQRDAAAWFCEWLALPQLVVCAGRALSSASQHLPTPDRAKMRDAIDDGSGLIYAEALSFALATTMPRPAAQAQVKDLCAQVQAQGGHLSEQASACDPTLFTPEANLGEAPAMAHDFVSRARSHLGEA